MRRREFIGLVGGATAALTLVARAQQAALPVVGFLGPGSPESDAYRVTAFKQGLREAGFVDGQNIRIEYRWARSHYVELQNLAVDLFVRGSLSSPRPALRQRSRRRRRPRPGGNVTGVTQAAAEAAPKRLELLHELLPAARVLALLVNPAAPVLAEPQARDVRAAAQTLGLELSVLGASTESELEAAFAKLTELRASGLVIGGDAFFTSHSKELAALAIRYRVPAVYQWREFVAAGGLMSYGSNVTETHRLVGLYTARILKGDKPSDLPVQQATDIELYINLKTARALGISIPLPLSGRANELFE
jgi:putative tryptophan/tyrosine transport system substrate-binding protein